jgi:hypothetical protein
VPDETVEGSELQSAPSLKELVLFIFGQPVLHMEIKVKFTNGYFPDPDSCFGIVSLPLMHTTYENFSKTMNVAINSQHVGYGRG